MIERNKKIEKEIKKVLNYSLSENNLSDIKSLIEELEIKCLFQSTCNWTDVRQFNLMFKTELGSTSESSSKFICVRNCTRNFFVNF